MALALTAAQLTGTFERSKSSAGKEKKGKEETMTLFYEGSKERLRWLLLYFSRVTFFFVFVWFLRGLVIFGTDQASLFTCLL